MPIDWDKVEVRPAERGRVRCERGWSLDREWSNRLPDYDLWLVWAGRGRMWLDGELMELRPGVCLWMRPGRLYLADHDPANRLGASFCHFSLAPRGRGRKEFPRDGEPAGLPGIVQRVDDLAYVDGVMRRLAELEDNATAAALLRGLLMDLDRGGDQSAGDRASGTALHHRQVALNAAAAIRESPGEAPTVQLLADAAGYSADHFTRVFTQVLGVPPTKFIVQQRIARAQQLLRETALSVTQVADTLGYSDVYFFSRQFKQITGRSPSGYRAS